MTDHSDTLYRVARDHGVKINVLGYTEGPTVDTYRIEPGPGVAPRKVAALVESWTLAVSAPVRWLGAEAGALCVEVPREHRTFVTLDAMDGAVAAARGPVVPFGMAASGPVVVALDNLPHVLIAGATGQGKSVLLTSMLASLVSQCGPDELMLGLVDPKQVELSAFAGLPHVAVPVGYDPSGALDVLEHAAAVMEARYVAMKAAGVRHVSELKPRTPPYVVVVDEVADLMLTSGKSVETLLVRIAQKGRAAGVHLIVATQYPKREVLTPLLKQNIPTRVALRTNDHVASNLILDNSGAEVLVGKGDALVMLNGLIKPRRVQAPLTPQATIDALRDAYPPEPEPADDPDVEPEVVTLLTDGTADGPVIEAVQRAADEAPVIRMRMDPPPAPEPEVDEYLTTLRRQRQAFDAGMSVEELADIASLAAMPLEDRVMRLEAIVREQGKIIQRFTALLNKASMLPLGGE